MRLPNFDSLSFSERLGIEDVEDIREIFENGIRIGSIGFSWSPGNKQFEFLKFFKNHGIESCMSIAKLVVTDDSEPEIALVGDRVFDLESKEFEDMKKVVHDALDKFGNLRLDFLSWLYGRYSLSSEKSEYIEKGDVDRRWILSKLREE